MVIGSFVTVMYCVAGSFEKVAPPIFHRTVPVGYSMRNTESMFRADTSRLPSDGL